DQRRPAEVRPGSAEARRPQHPASTGQGAAGADLYHRRRRRRQLPRTRPRVHGEHDREHRFPRLRYRWPRRAPGRRTAGFAGLLPLGAGGGGVLADRMGDRHPEHIARALAIEVSLIGGAAVLAAAVHVRPNAVSGDVVIALLAFAMGVRNATVRRVGVPDLTTTVLTMTLTGLAADSPAAGGSGKGSVRRVAAVLAMLTGALAGALLLKTSLALPLVATAGLALVTWLVYVPAARRAV